MFHVVEFLFFFLVSLMIFHWTPFYLFVLDDALVVMVALAREIRASVSTEVKRDPRANISSKIGLLFRWMD